MNEVVNAGMGTAVVAEPSMKHEIVGTLLETFRHLPQKYQMAFYGMSLLSAVGLTAYGMSKNYGVTKDAAGVHLTNATPVAVQQ